MKTAEPKAKPVATFQKASQPFFSKEGERSFLGESRIGEFSFFRSASDFSGAKNNVVQRKCTGCEQHENPIQRQEQPGPIETKPVSPGDAQSPVPLGRKPRAVNCNSDPKFPNFGCLGTQLKLDIDENLLNNSHQFYQVASLYPGDNELMWNTFLRYGIGKNLLETSFGFMGVNKKWGNILSYGTGIGMKSYQLLKDGQLKLDVQIPLGKGINLDIKLDYNANPGKPGEEKGVNTSIGFSGRF